MIPSVADVNNRATVSRLRVHARGLDPLSARLRVESHLGEIDWRPGCLPPAAVLIVRRLRDPRPGLLGLVPADRRPSEEWSTAVTGTLERLARTAARPAIGPVPLDAEAVVFLDHSELLACLARDRINGELAGRWWWRSVLKSGPGGDAIADAWVASPRDVPAALQHLAARGQAASFVRTLTETASEALAVEIIRVHGLHFIDVPSIDTQERDDFRGNPSPPDEAAHAPEPWSGHVPEARPGELGPAHRYLLGVALTIRRAPATARSLPFLLAIARWKSGPDGGPRRPAVEPESAAESANQDIPATEVVRSRRLDPDSVPETMPKPRRGADSIPPPVDPLVSAMTAEGPGKAATLPETTRTPPDPPRLDLPRAELVGDQPGVSAARAATPPGVSAVAVGARVPDAPPFDYRERDSLELETIRVETEFGGIFYLINLALFLGLYADFTRPLDRGLGLSIWDFLLLLGERLLPEGFGDDPAVPLLADLAGRGETTPPGAGFEPPTDWRIPETWLAAFPGPSPWQWGVAGGRLHVRHPEGFPVLDVDLPDGDVEGVLREELQAYRAGRVTTAERVDSAFPDRLMGTDSSLSRWLDRLAPFVEARLARALGWTPAGPRFVRQRARVSSTATHLDVSYSLQDHPVEVRLAGLDRNPGWVPAAGRDVTFHFD